MPYTPCEGDRLLDVGAGTGVVAECRTRRVGATGSVIAVDPNEGMLAVAERLARRTWTSAWRSRATAGGQR